MYINDCAFMRVAVMGIRRAFLYDTLLVGCREEQRFLRRPHLPRHGLEMRWRE